MLRAVIFDYGQVLSGPPASDAVEAVMKLLGVDRSVFDRLYWANRSAYDAGRMTGEGYWLEIGAAAGIEVDGEILAELLRQDGRVWMDVNQPMLSWQRQLKQAGIRTAVLSNMGDAVQRELEHGCTWLQEFDVCLWSNQLKCVKPDPAIYLAALNQLQIAPHETLFLDDRAENVTAANEFGMVGIEYCSMERLRTDLLIKGFTLPLPSLIS